LGNDDGQSLAVVHSAEHRCPALESVHSAL
jgi:hypothetical protein